MKISNLLAAAGLVAAATSAHAVDIPGLFNTGVSTGTTLLAGGTTDTHYIFSATAGTAVGTFCNGVSGARCGVATSDGSFPLNVWLPNASSTVSKWLTPTATQGQSYDSGSNGTYTWTLSFNLTGFVPSTALLAGRFLADNSGEVRLNSNLLATTPADSFTTWTTFAAPSSSFIAGLNTLTFTVTNTINPPPALNPTGLRVEFTSSSVSPVPEPSAMLLTLAGLAMVGGLAKRRLANNG